VIRDFANQADRIATSEGNPYQHAG